MSVDKGGSLEIASRPGNHVGERSNTWSFWKKRSLSYRRRSRAYGSSILRTQNGLFASSGKHNSCRLTPKLKSRVQKYPLTYSYQSKYTNLLSTRDDHLLELERIASAADDIQSDPQPPASSQTVEAEEPSSSSLSSSLASPNPAPSSSTSSMLSASLAAVADSVLSSLPPRLSAPFLPAAVTKFMDKEPPATSGSGGSEDHGGDAGSQARSEPGGAYAGADEKLTEPGSLSLAPPASANASEPAASAEQRKDEALIAGLRAMSQRFGSDCDERRAVSSYQFEQLWSQLLPPPMRFLLWMMVQSEDFYEPHHQDPAAAAAAAKSLHPSVSGERIILDANPSTARSVGQCRA